MTTPSEIDEAAFRAFKEATFGTEYMIWHDGLDTSRVERLSGAAREHALAMLRFGLEAGDQHAAQALAAMGDRRSRDAMITSLASAEDARVVHIALAAHALVADPELALHLVRVLRGISSWSIRIDAAIGLRRFAGAEDEAALLDAVALDPDYLVRYHAAESLLSRWAVKPSEISRHPEIFARLSSPAEGAPTAAHLEGYAEARRMLEARRPRSGSRGPRRSRKTL